MSDPLALLPFALAAAGGSINGFSTAQLVAAGVTLLQRSAPLVRALSGRRSAIMLETGPEWLWALAASDGRGALLVAPNTSAGVVANMFRRANVGAAFTAEAYRHLLPSEFPVVLLDDMPRSATVCIGDRQNDVDLGSHHGLNLQGVNDVGGAPDECVVTWDAGGTGDPALKFATHRDLLRQARMLTRTDAPLGASENSTNVIRARNSFDSAVALAAALLGGAAIQLPRVNELRDDLQSRRPLN